MTLPEALQNAFRVVYGTYANHSIYLTYQTDPDY